MYLHLPPSHTQGRNSACSIRAVTARLERRCTRLPPGTLLCMPLSMAMHSRTWPAMGNPHAITPKESHSHVLDVIVIPTNWQQSTHASPPQLQIKAASLAWLAVAATHSGMHYLLYMLCTAYLTPSCVLSAAPRVCLTAHCAEGYSILCTTSNPPA